jgi:hypothetical protein
MPSTVSPSRLFHAIVVVGLAAASTACGGSEESASNTDGGEGGAAADAAEAGAMDAPEVIFGGNDGAPEATGVGINPTGGPDAASFCDAGDASRACWPTYV